MENQENQLIWEDWNNTSENQTTSDTVNETFDWDTNTDQNMEWSNQTTQEDNKFVGEENNQNEDNVNDNNNLETFNWEKETSDETIESPSTMGVESSSPNIDTDEFFNFLGSTNELYFNGFLFDIKVDNFKLLEEVNSQDLQLMEEDGRYSFNPTQDSELGKLVHALVKIGVNHNTKIVDCSIIKTQPSESFLNIFKGKPQFNFIYFAQSDETSGDIVIDFSTMGGPSYNIDKPSSQQLLLLPGWIPYRISKNKYESDNILITGMYA